MLFEGGEAKCAFVFNLLEAILYAVPQGSFARSSATKFHQDVSHALSKVFLYLALVLRYVFCSPALSWCMVCGSADMLFSFLMLFSSKFNLVVPPHWLPVIYLLFGYYVLHDCDNPRC